MTALAVSWDEWRAAYDEWGFEQQQEFYDQVFEVARRQGQFDAVQIDGFISEVIGENFDVVELGGWDGELAAAILADHPPIRSWTNYEICRAAADASVCDDPRFFPVALDDWYWTRQHRGDLFVASHVLEHLSLRDVRRVLDATDTRYAYIQCPLASGPTDWTGYHGSHILEVGWPDLVREMEVRGWSLIPELSRRGIGCFQR